MDLSDSNLEGNPRIRFGFYLRPSYEMSRAQAEMHDLFRRQFGLKVAGEFMPHATVMGFFRSEGPLASIMSALNGALAGKSAFTVTNNGPKPHGREGISLDVHHDADGKPNGAMQAAHEAVFVAIEPLIHPACEFAFRAWSGEHFRAHLTLAMADVPNFLFDEVLAFIESAAPIGPRQFLAEYFHLYAFESDDWGGAWWNTISWRPLHSWRLPA